MTLAINLSAETERRLSTRARREGVDVVTLATRLLDAEAQRVAGEETSLSPDRATLDLLAGWNREQQTSDLAEIARRERELKEFMEGMNQARIESEGPDARKIYP